MATPREGFIELHDATVRALSIRSGGACEFALEGVSRYRHIAGARFLREVYQATLSLSGCDRIEVQGLWDESDNYLMEAAIAREGVELSVWPDIAEEIAIRGVVLSLFSGATIRIRCTGGVLRVEGEAIDSGEWLSEQTTE